MSALRSAGQSPSLRRCNATIVKSLKLIVAGKKGFLGIGKTPNKYEAEAFQQAVVEIIYKGKAKVSAKVVVRDWTKEGTDLLEQGRFREAINCFDKAIDVDPQDVRAWFNKGYCLNQLEDYDAALAYFDKVLAAGPKAKNAEWMAWTMKGICLKSLGRTEDALKCYDKALDINPQDFMALYNKGCILREQKRYEEALVYFKRTIALGSNPNYYNARFNAGGCLVALERHEEAAQYLG